MNHFHGISISEFPFRMIERVGVLLYQEFPVTTLYLDEEGSPIVKEWIDCQGDIDRFIIYRTERTFLRSYIDGKISHRDLIQNSADGLSFILDSGSDKGNQIIKIVSTVKLPREYLPKSDVYFNTLDGVDTEAIRKKFGLDQIALDDQEITVQDIAKDQGSELFNLHLKSGPGVGLGRIDTDLLGEFLLDFDNLYTELGLDYFYGQTRGEIKIKAQERAMKVDSISTEVFAYKAASFSIYIKPKHDSQLDLIDGKTETNLIAEKIFALFQISENSNSLQEQYTTFSDFVYRAYQNFLKSIIQHDVFLDLTWTNPSLIDPYSEDFNLSKAHQILDRIEAISSVDNSSFFVKGKFTALNCDTGWFKFTSTSDENYSGYFEKRIRESMQGLTFIDSYDIKVERQVVKEAGNSDLKIKDMITSTFPFDE